MKKYIYNLILCVIPHKYIRFAFKYINIDFLFFGYSLKHVGKYLINERKHPPSFEENLSNEILSGFQQCCNDYLGREELLREYVLQCDDCIIEPKYGWGILYSSNKLVFDSISNNAWIETYHPSFINYIVKKSNAHLYPEIISIRMLKGGQKNFWHFFHDLLGQVCLAQKYKLDHLPFVISKQLYDQPYYQQAVARSSYLQGLTWVVQDKQYIKAETAYYMQKELNSNEQFIWAREILEVPDADPQQKRKVFLTRNKNRIRHINNSLEIEKIAIHYGFEIVDTDNLTLDMQIKLFSEIEFLIGIHGAGLTNMIFRKSAPMNILEIFPMDYIQPHYYWLGKGLGHSYHCLTGGTTLRDTSFSMNAEQFDKKLKEFISD